MAVEAAAGEGAAAAAGQADQAAGAGVPGGGEPAQVAASRLQLVSWNVAGWKTTLEHIKRFKGGLLAFLQGHHADILCLQEVKLCAKAIAGDAQKLGAEVPGYESFWACNEGTGAQRQGLNGVATFARQGFVLRADAKPLRDAELDSEGRCLLTDHGSFVVFNVYVPNSAGGPRLPFKLRWLRALRAAMVREREAGKAVILAGDLNMKHRSADVHWSFRSVDVLKLRELAAQRFPGGDGLSYEAREAIEVVSANWLDIAAALRSKELRTFETRNTHRGQTFQRWGVFAKAKSGDLVRLGPPFDSEDCARASFQVDGTGIEQDGQIVLGLTSQDATYVLQRPGVMSMGELSECLAKLAGLEVGQRALKEIADAFACLGAAPSMREWLEGVLRQDGMVDSFAELHPHAQERFTCWDQYKNKRHENVGARIDYVLVDRALFERHARRGAGLEACGKPEADSPAAALAAATLGGLSRPSSFAGGGMPPLEEDEYFAQFRSEPSSGMVYTPPQLSDHIGVSLLLEGCPLPAAAGGSGRDAATAQCQPHRTAKRITDFFGRRAEGPPAKRPALGG